MNRIKNKFFISQKLVLNRILRFIEQVDTPSKRLFSGVYIRFVLVLIQPSLLLSSITRYRFICQFQIVDQVDIGGPGIFRTHAGD